MNTDSAVTVMHEFLNRSPRTSVEVQLVLNDETWLWRHGNAEHVQSPVFEIGSIGKTFTSTLLALLLERQQVSLSDTVERFYPKLPWGRQVTLQQLASHTSGLPANPFSQWQMMRRGRQLAEAFQADDLMVFLQQLPATLKAGGNARYSNVGMALLGRILGDVYGKSYGEAVQDLILQPLGMYDTHLDPSHYDPERLIDGHDASGRPVPPFRWKGMEAAGVWRSTGNDMMTFLGAQMGFYGSPWDSLAKTTTQPYAKISQDTQVGLGWLLSPIKPHGMAAWHSGGTFGQHSIAAWSVEQSAAVVVLTDRIPPWWHHLMPGRQLELVPQRLVLAIRG
ncbi:serine hydrolase domain-containing protein [Nitrincola alkalilacustris]|uniref:serine hydrolase domain-containing protein n=1 Tax=Nitrincola alkalilacustris TaxID=1571224 RepID=UPI00124C6D4B|nr:serine hydrolase domain-containing protein [Nitrincola alkalilacustris]